MSDVMLYAVLGLGAGAAYALIAQGLILVHRGTGVVNFAQGAIAMIAAYLYTWLANDGFSPVVAVVLSLIGAAVLGAVIQRVVMHPLSRAPLLAKLVATLGLMLVLQAAASLIFGTELRTVPPILPTNTVSAFGVMFGVDRLVLLVIVLILAAALSAFSNRTNTGALVRGASDSEAGVALLGYSLNAVSALTWVLGSVLAGFAGIVLAPMTALDIVTMILLVIPALAVCLLAKFSSFWVASIAGLVLGVGQSVLANYWPLESPTIDGIQQGLPFLLIIVVMVWRGRSIPDRTTLSIGRPPTASPARGKPAVLLGVVVIAVVVTYMASASYQTAISIGLISGIIALSLVVLTGYIGQISLAQIAFAGLGAYFCSVYADRLGLPFPLPIFIAAVTVVPVGILLALPALKVRGVNLAVVTLGAAVAIDALVFKDSNLTGGFNGAKVPPPVLFGIEFDGVLYPFRFAMLALAALILCVALVAWVRRSSLGLTMLAIRDNERAASAEGVNIVGTKLIAFAISAFLAGVAGAMLGYLYGSISFERFAPLASIGFLAVAYIGGIGSIGGAIFAGLLVAGGPIFNLMSSNPQIDRYQMLIAGLGVVFTAIYNPDGLGPFNAAQFQKLKARLSRSRVGEGGARDVDVSDTSAGKSEIDTTLMDSLTARAGAVPDSRMLLEVKDVRVEYSGVTAVDGVSLQYPSGALIGLIGPNGAGKTTFIDAVCGFVDCTGQITFDGEEIEGVPAYRRARLGLRRTFQNVELFDDLTVRENLQLRGSNSSVSTEGTTIESLTVDQTLELVGLAGRGDVYPGELSTGERKLAGLARALRGGSRMLLLDEPAAGLDSHESEILGQRLRGLLGLGLTILLVDHDLNLVMGVCDRVDVLDQGRLIASGPPEAVRVDPAVRSAYIGDAPEAATGVSGELVR
ncbi:ABC-type branched-subunit amino acid transport system permease subunit/ABC-type branched-subunit amino acid transport system ATPase component [Rhodococcus sp. 27YEA15]|uniref:ABC transporter permease subunit n=1 Tax=Rhodococcus sp. 27YEA15 TaxID=3156259 RepID=UPI003C7A319F